LRLARLLLPSIALVALLTGCGTVAHHIDLDAARIATQEDPAQQDDALVSAAAWDGFETTTSDDATDGAPALLAEADSDRIVQVSGSIDGVELVRVTGPVSENDGDATSALIQQQTDLSDADAEEYDPWESFNEKMFTFNRNVDKYVLKPIAYVYNLIMPEPWQVMIANGFDNIKFVPRFVNNLLQAKWGGASRELGRFLINSTFGIGGLFDPAKDYWGIQKSSEDFGQTLGVWGVTPGPYLIVPFTEPLTVRDGIGTLVDSLLNPLSYFIPFIWDRLGMRLGEVINDRALNYDLFQGFEESLIERYSAVRHGDLQRRERLIKE